MKRGHGPPPGDGSPPGVAPGAGPGVALFMRALPLGGFVLAVILEEVVPLGRNVGWFPTPVRGFLAVVLLLGGLLLFAAGHLALSGAGKRAGVVETWPFSWSRHPMYLGLLVMFAGIGLAFRLFWTVPLLPLLLAICHFGVVGREEKYLEEKFGPTYRNYQARVRRWL